MNEPWRQCADRPLYAQKYIPASPGSIGYQDVSEVVVAGNVVEVVGRLVVEVVASNIEVVGRIAGNVVEVVGRLGVEVVAGNVVEVVGLLVVEVVAAAVDDKHWLVLQMVPSAGMHLRLLHWDEVCNVVVIHKGGLMGIHKGSQKRY